MVVAHRHRDHLVAARRVLLVRLDHLRHFLHAAHARCGPEIDQHHLAAQVGRGEAIAGEGCESHFGRGRAPLRRRFRRRRQWPGREEDDNASFMKAAIFPRFAAAVMFAPRRRPNWTGSPAGKPPRAESGAGEGVHAASPVGRIDGFGNPQVKIPLPESLQRAERLMRAGRHGKARRPAHPYAQPRRRSGRAGSEAAFLDSVRRMTLQDAKGILAAVRRPRTDMPAAAARLPAHREQGHRAGRAAAKYNDYADTAVAW